MKTKRIAALLTSLVLLFGSVNVNAAEDAAAKENSEIQQAEDCLSGSSGEEIQADAIIAEEATAKGNSTESGTEADGEASTEGETDTDTDNSDKAEPITAEDAVVYLTVSNKGILAADRDGEVMASRKVTVSDENRDGKLTFHEALLAAHKAYNSEDGYVYGSGTGVSVTALWGVETYNTLFFINNVGLLSGVGVDTVKDGDMLTASINADSKYYADWYTFFDKTEVTASINEEFGLTLRGFWGMAYLEEDLAPTELSGISVGTWSNGGFTAINDKATDEAGKVTLSFAKPGTYYVSASGTVKDTVTDWWTMTEVEFDCPIIAPYCIVTVEGKIPEEITIEHNAKNTIDNKVVTYKGDRFKLTAYDENGEETPVLWSMSPESNLLTLDSETGEIEVTEDIYGSVSYLYFTAVSVLDGTVSAKLTVQATGFALSDYYKNYTVALSEDGQTAKTASVSGGINGHNIWRSEIPEGIGEIAAEPGNGSSLKLNVYRPGTVTYGYKLDINEQLGDSGTITVSGVAVEDAEGKRTKTYLGISSENPNPTVQLTAYVAEGRAVSAWESSDETIAAVDGNGLVTAVGVGDAIIYAIDSEGARGGIRVVAESEEIPYFESLEFLTTAFTSGAWVKEETFQPTRLEYDLPIRAYSTSSLTLQAATLYNTEKYTAVAEYTDVNGEKQTVNVNSGKATTLANQPFGASVLTITLSEKENNENATVYTFNVTRPRDTSKVLKNTSGIALSPDGRDASATAYNGVKEAVIQRANEDGSIASGTGVASNVKFYRTFVYDDVEGFRLNLTSSTSYAHIRYSLDGGEVWAEAAQGGGYTRSIDISGKETIEVLIQVLDDSTYNANVTAGKDGFSEAEATQYKLWIDLVSLVNPVILTAKTDSGDWYPEFSTAPGTYRIMVENGAEAPVLTFTAGEGSTVKIGASEQEPDENGIYTLTLGSSQTSVVVSDAEGSFSNTYNFLYKAKSALDVPDRVVDYLVMGSQYTNSASFGAYPELILGGATKSLGNFGGYVTFYYEEPIVDNPNNKYGLDFYVIGNSQEKNIDSMAELGQVYVSQDNKEWYALAGSEHYEDKAIWDYTITYTKGEDGKAYWTDNFGNSINYAAKPWPSSSVYYMNGTAASDTYTFTGVAFKSQLGSIMGDGTNGSYAASARFGYADYYASNISGTTVTDVNSYAENPSKANGFDLAWAVDKNGIPVDVSDKEFHYIKVATASNIYAGSFMEKSTEVFYAVRTTAQETAVGKTEAPTGVTVSDGAESVEISFTEGQTVYEAELGSMKYVTVKVIGAAEDDNIYINNQRVASGTAAKGFKVTKEKGETLVRVIVQNGEREPVLYLLRLTSDAIESDELIEGIRINVNGTVREAGTENGTVYTASVGHRIDSVSFTPIIAGGITLTVDGEELLESYDLSYGENSFELTASDNNGNTQTVTLNVTRSSAPTSSDRTITVKFTLYGDSAHGEDEYHTYRNNRSELPVWIKTTAYTVNSGSTVLDVFERAMADAGFSFVNADGNYISEINGLAEFDNGPVSGWMYTVDGKYPELGLAEQNLSNNDKIVFHYTDDYTKEESADSFGSSVSSAPVGEITEKYTVRFETGSDDTVKSQRIERNETVQEPAVPQKEGFVFEGWYKDKDLTQKYDFTSKVTKSFTLYAKYAEEIEDTRDNGKKASFVDVRENSWYAAAVDYVVKNGLFNGISETEFAPDGSMTRAMAVTVLYRLEAPAEAGRKHSFKDVESGEWYADAVAWASENKIVTGIDNETFAPMESITREQLAAILYRYAAIKGCDIEKSSALAMYTDLESISPWALEALMWAKGNGIINGTSNTDLSPSATATRAQVAAILMRFDKLLAALCKV